MKTKKRIALELLPAILFAWVAAAPAATADLPQISPLPLAQNAKPKPDEMPEQRQARERKQLNVQMNVLIGSHDYDRIDKITQDWLAQVRAKKMSPDDYFNSLASIAPRLAGKGMVDELVAWTRARPDSYAAWYTLGVQYQEIAWSERGHRYASETTEAQFSEMVRYASLSRQAFLRSIQLGTDPSPSYSQLIKVAAITAHRGRPTTDTLTSMAAIARQMIMPSAQPRHFCPAKGSAAAEFETARDEQLYYLCLGLQRNPEATLPFDNFVFYNSPRWGGSYAMLHALLADIESTRHPSPKALGEMRADLLYQEGTDTVDLDANPDKGARLVVQAFDAAPTPAHVDWLYKAANTENLTVKDKEYARSLFKRIIAYRPGEATAIAGIGWLDEERGDLKGYMNGMIAAGNLGMFEAQNNLGYYYMVGQRGLPRDLQQARAWLTLAANQGFEHAREKLAVVDAMIAQEAKK